MKQKREDNYVSEMISFKNDDESIKIRQTGELKVHEMCKKGGSFGISKAPKTGH